MIRCWILASLAVAVVVLGATAFAEAQPKNIERANGRVILQGAQGERGWTLTIVQETGKMSSTVSADGEGFIILGACTLP